MSVRAKALLSFAATLVGVAIFCLFASYAVIFDIAGNVSEISIVNSQETQRFTKIGRMFFTVPQTDGVIEVRCSNGNAIRRGYVAHYSRTWMEIGRNSACA